MITYYVEINAPVNGNGTREKPFATIEAAKDAVRALVAAGLTEPVTVSIGAGEYSTAGLVFDEGDTGSADCPIAYRGEGNVILNGGVTLSAVDFEPLTEGEKARLHGEAKERVVRVDLTKLGLTTAALGVMPSLGSYTTASKYDGGTTGPMYCELFVDNRRMTVARYPDTDYLRAGDIVTTGDGLEIGGKKKKTAAEWAAQRNPPSDVYAIAHDTAVRASGWQSLDDVWVFCYPMYTWADMSSPIHWLDAEKDQMELTYVSMYGVRANMPYYFYNVFEELDAPGEWYLNRDSGVLYLYPPTDCDFARAHMTLSLKVNPIIEMTNVQHITISGLTLTASRSHGIVVEGDHIEIENCTVSNVADWGILLQGNHNTVSGCEIMYTGRGGIRCTGGDRDTLTSSECRIVHNHIHDVGEIFHTYHPAVGLNGVGILCAHNELHDSSHMLLSFSGNNHIIEYNEIYNACKFADDSSSIYSGRNYTTCGHVIRCNYFHDIFSDADSHIGIFGVYCDDNNGSCTIEKNIFLRCQSALLLHGGHDMIFRNNLILEACAKSQYALRFHDYGYWKDLLPGGTHEKGLAAVPWEGAIWSEAYPHIREYLTWDPETEQRFPHYCDLSKNIIINHKPIDIRFRWEDERFHNVVADNIEVQGCDIHALTVEKLYEILPTFEEIPFDKIGRGKV